MNREDARELWPIIKAFGDGEDVEYQSCGRSTWAPKSEDCAFNQGPSHYRIKPEPREFNICPAGCMIQQLSGKAQWPGKDAEWIKVREILSE